MFFKRLNFKLSAPSAGLALIFLAITQAPMAINESLRLACILTTHSDYAIFWNWKDIPLDARLRYCNGGDNSLKRSKSLNNAKNFN